MKMNSDDEGEILISSDDNIHQNDLDDAIMSDYSNGEQEEVKDSLKIKNAYLSKSTCRIAPGKIFWIVRN